MKKLISALICLCFVFLSPSFVFAESATILPSIDTYLDTAGFGDSSYDNQQFLLSSYALNNMRMGYILIKFPLNTIPAGATIKDAKVYLYMYESSGISPVDITAVSILSDWNAQVSLLNQPVMGHDVTTTGVTSTKGYKIWNITSIVKSWLDGTIPNNGVYILRKSPQNPEFVRKFYSQNRGNANTNPKLVISYTPKVSNIFIPLSEPLKVEINPSVSIRISPIINFPLDQNEAAAGQNNVIISDVRSSSITQSDARITWKTDTMATSWAVFGIATYGNKFDQKVGQNDAVTSHNINVSFLTPNTKYSYKVMSKGADGVEVFGSTNYFTTTGFENTPSNSDSESLSNTREQTADQAGDSLTTPLVDASTSESVPATQSSRVQSRNFIPSSFFLSIQSLTTTKVIGVLLTLLGLMCVIGVILLFLLTKKAHNHAKKEMDRVNKNLKEGGEND